MPPRLSTAAQREERRDKVMALVLGGAIIRQIERQTGISRGTIARDIHARLEAAAAQCPHTVEYRELHRERLNQLLVKWWPKAVDDPAAFDRVLRLLEREAKLLGLDAPQKLEHSGSLGAEPLKVEVVWHDAPDDPKATDEREEATDAN